MKGKTYFVGLVTILAITFNMQLNGQCNSTCGDLIFNGDFELGNTGFTSGLTHNSSCAYTSYSIEDNALDKCANSGWNSVTDHTTGNGLFMVIDGNSQYPDDVWETNVNLVSGEDYEFNFWIYPTVSINPRPQIDIVVDGSTVVGSFNANGITVQWTPVCITFTAPVSGNVSISIFQTNAGGSGYDYGLDDISLRPVNCCDCGVESSFQMEQEDCVTYSFSSTSTGTPCTDVMEAIWDFGDGTTATGSNISHVFPGPGVYNVCLRSVGFDGFACCSDSTCVEVLVEDCDDCECNVAPDFVYETEECKVNFIDRSEVEDPCVRIIGWDWDFGDGTGANTQNPSHTYTASGTYVVCLTTYAVADGDTCERRVCYKVTVDCPPCECNIEPQFNYLIDGCNVNFFDISIPDSCVNIFQWEWNFGDGTSSTLQNPVHSYAGPGGYTVCMTVWGENGAGDTCEYEICRDIPVEECEPCPCELRPDYIYQVNACEVRFTDRTESSCEILSWNWDFGDGTYASVPNPTHHFENPGTYQVCLTTLVYDAESQTCCEETICYEVVIKDDCRPCECQPQVSFFEYNVRGCEVQFNMDVEAECEIMDIMWDFGDGNTISGIFSPGHGYAYQGTYNVCVTIFYVDFDGKICTETYCETVRVDDCKKLPCDNIQSASPNKMSQGSTESEGYSPFEMEVYPNPTSGEISVDFYIPNAGKVEIGVYDGSGKQISTLADSELNEGKHSVNWNFSGSGIASGVYYIFVKSEGQKEYKKIVFND